ncbi:hypothetical protein CFP56_025525, partial [Quercus suber]
GESCNTTDTIVNLTDSGNLVLYGYSYEYGNVTSLWESFENLGMLLSGRDDPGSGNFTFMNAIIVNKEGTTIYWKSLVKFCKFLTTIEVQNDNNFENARLVLNFSGKIEYWT